MAAASPSDPQTWNRYAYVRNSPLEHTDPVGMMMKQAGNGGGGGGMLGVYIGPFGDGGWSSGWSDLTLSGYPVDPSVGAAWATTVGLDPSPGAQSGLAPPSGSVPPGEVCIAFGGPEQCHNAEDDHVSTNILMTVFDPLGTGGQASPSPMSAPPCTGCGEVYDRMRELAGQINQRPIGKFVAVVYGASVATGAMGATVVDLAAGPEQSVLFGRFSPVNGGFPGYLNSWDFLRIGYGWDGQTVFRIGGDVLEYFMENPHIDLWRF